MKKALMIASVLLVAVISTACINNIAVQMSIGLSSKIVSDVIVKLYKKYILNQYFR